MNIENSNNTDEYDQSCGHNSSGRSTLKTGRKGDPRMHRAVEARLANPHLSLFEALKIGGFNYSSDEDTNCVDTDNITLTQRKNQLSRRVRHARHQQEQQKKILNNLNQSQYHSNTTAIANQMQKELRLQYLFATAVNDQSQPNHLDRKISGQKRDSQRINEEVDGKSQKKYQKNQEEDQPTFTGLHSQIQPILTQSTSFNNPKHHQGCPCNFPMDLESGTSFLGDQMRQGQSAIDLSRNKSHFMSTNNHVFQQSFPEHQAVNITLQQQQAIANAAGSGQDRQGTNSASMMAPHVSSKSSIASNEESKSQSSLHFYNEQDSGNQQQALDESQGSEKANVAIASLMRTAKSIGLSLDQFASGLQAIPDLHSTVALSVQTGATWGENQTAKQGREELALAFFRNESQSLYKRSMLLAGYPVSAVEADEKSQEMLQFAIKAWQSEGLRLQTIISDERQHNDQTMHSMNLGSTSHNYETATSRDTTNKHEVPQTVHPDHFHIIQTNQLGTNNVAPKQGFGDNASSDRHTLVGIGCTSRANVGDSKKQGTVPANYINGSYTENRHAIRINSNLSSETTYNIVNNEGELRKYESLENSRNFQPMYQHGHINEGNSNFYGNEWEHHT